MADDSDLYVEGYSSAGKQLERIDQRQRSEIHTQTIKDKNEIDNKLSHETDALTKLQGELNQINEEYLKKKAEKKALVDNKEVHLDTNRTREINDIMNQTVEKYLEKRPTSKDEKRSVHVYFLSGEECGSELHIGREGAGSRDATFIVTLSQTVDSLARQAAKYWGLDPNKVFFLDRDGRIVQGKMCLSDIILPPVETYPNATDSKESAAGSRDAGSSSALALPGGNDTEQIQGYTLKGKDYSLTLVRAKTVLAKEDLSKPKGETWHDFTFDQKRLNEDLEKTRKKRGDPDPKQDKVSMDNIPSLWELIKKGQDRKFKKAFDKWCRLLELALFLIMVFFFIFLLKPDDSWTFRMNMVGEAVESMALDFDLAEQTEYGIHNFSGIMESPQYEAWLRGPLQRAILPGGLDRLNIYVMKVQGRIYKSPAEIAGGINWCPEPEPAVPYVNNSNVTGTTTTTTTTSTINCTVWPVNCSNATNATTTMTTSTTTEICYPLSLKQCPTADVVELMFFALQRNQTVPECKPRYDLDPIIAGLRSLVTIDAFSYVSGQISSYLGGLQYNFSVASAEDWLSTINDFLPSSSAHNNIPAKLITLVSYVPALDSLLLTQFLTEFTPSGPLITTTKRVPVALDDGLDYEVAFYVLCILLAFVILLSELRRITGFPQRCYYEENKDKVRVWTAIFLIVPVLLIIALAMRLNRLGVSINLTNFSNFNDDNLEPNEHRVPSFLSKSVAFSWTAAENVMYEVQNLIFLDNTVLMLNLTNFTLMVLLSVRYFLMYFPEMTATTMMVHRVAKPLAVTFFFLVCSFAFFGMMFYLILGDSIYGFRNWMSTMLATVQFAHGGLKNWRDFHISFGWAWWWLMTAAFLVFVVNFNNFAIAVLISHKKEAELHRNYSSHPFWQTMHREHMQAGTSSRMNPALVGYDFTYKDFSSSKEGPRKVTEPPGLKI